MAASVNLLQITSVDLMHPQSKALPVRTLTFHSEGNADKSMGIPDL